MKIRHIIFCSLLASALVTILILTGFIKRDNTNILSVYQVYLDGKKLGNIASEDELYALINDDQAEIKEKYQVDNVYPPNGFNIVKYNTYDSNLANVNKIYSKIKEEKAFTIKGYEILIQGIEDEEDKKIYVLDNKIFDEATTNVVHAFIESNKFEAYLKNKQAPVVDTGEIIRKVYFNEQQEKRLVIREAYIDANAEIFTNTLELTQYLLFGTNAEKETYVVKSGDTIESIAYDHQLNTQEFLLANPKFTSENAILVAGEKVVITLINPVLALVCEKEVTEDIEIVYDTDPPIYDNTKVSSYKVITRPGENGIERTTRATKTINGAEVSQSEISNKIVIKPVVNEQITRGRKVVENPGHYVDNNLTWAWPTNTPYTKTSPYGYRWGTLHDGMDISGTGYGSPIYASLGGVVISSGAGGLGGWQGGIAVTIDHENGYFTLYAHMSRTLVKVGDRVERKQKIGLMGNTGFVVPAPTRSMPLLGTHLHFSAWCGRPYAGGSRSFNPELLWTNSIRKCS